MASSATTAPSPGAPVSTTALADGSTVTDLRLADGSRIALYLPPELSDDFVLEASAASMPAGVLTGQRVQVIIRFDYCNGTLQDRGEINDLGTLVAVSQSGRVVACRPDQRLVVEAQGAGPLDDADLQAIHLVPLAYGEDWARAVADFEGAAVECCATEMGPLTLSDGTIVVSNGFLDGQVMAIDASTLEIRWRTRIGDESFLFGAAASSPGVVLAAPHVGRVVGLDLADGHIAWELPLEDAFVTGAAPGASDIWFVTSDHGGEGDARPPEIRAIDPHSGETHWQQQGFAGTDWQWMDPIAHGDVVVMLDVPNPLSGGDTASLWAFDASSGDVRWTLPLDSPTEGFAPGLVVSDEDRDLILVTTPDGVAFRVDPATGGEAWRNAIGFGLISEVGSETVTIKRGPQSIVLDLNTGLNARPAPEVSSLPLDQPIPLRILAVRPNNPSLAMLDFEIATEAVYGPGVHTMPADATDGAVIAPTRQTIIWTNGVAHLFDGPLNQPGLVLGDDAPRDISGFAPALRVVPSPDGKRAWLVQPGIAYGAIEFPTLIALVDLATGRTITEARSAPNTFPVAATSTGLVLTGERLIDTGDGWISEPGSEHVIVVDSAAGLISTGHGAAIAATPSRVIRLACPEDVPQCDVYRDGELIVSDADGSDERVIPQPIPGIGVWQTLGGPIIPSDAMPLRTLSPDNRFLLIRIGFDLDVNGRSTSSRLVVVDLETQLVRTILESTGPTPLATWSHDGAWIALIDIRDVQLINVADPSIRIDLPEVIPVDHFPLAAG